MEAQLSGEAVGKSANVEPAQENQRIAGDGRRAGTGVDPADHRRRQGERSGYRR